jgi:hypothetical protein
MITADKLRLLTNMPAAMLTQGIQQAGYKQDRFTSAKFVGITNAGEFAYLAVFPVEGGTDSCKVFVNYDPTEDRVVVDY